MTVFFFSFFFSFWRGGGGVGRLGVRFSLLFIGISLVESFSSCHYLMVPCVLLWFLSLLSSPSNSLVYFCSICFSKLPPIFFLF